MSSPLTMNAPCFLMTPGVSALSSCQGHLCSLPRNMNPTALRRSIFIFTVTFSFPSAGSCSHISLILRLSHTMSLTTSPHPTNTVEEIEKQEMACFNSQTYSSPNFLFERADIQRKVTNPHSSTVVFP